MRVVPRECKGVWVVAAPVAQRVGVEMRVVPRGGSKRRLVEIVTCQERMK